MISARTNDKGYAQQTLRIADQVAIQRRLNAPRLLYGTIVFGDYPNVCFYMDFEGTFSAKFPTLARPQIPFGLKRWMQQRNLSGLMRTLKWNISLYGEYDCPTLQTYTAMADLTRKKLDDLVIEARHERSKIPWDLQRLK